MVSRDDQERPISILVLDEPGIMRASLRALLATVPHFQLCPSADLGEASWELVEELRPDCLLIVCANDNRDLPLPEFIAMIKTTWPEIRCLVSTISSERNREYLAAGADLSLANGFTLGSLCQSIDLLFKLREADQSLC